MGVGEEDESSDEGDDNQRDDEDEDEDDEDEDEDEDDHMHDNHYVHDGVLPHKLTGLRPSRILDWKANRTKLQFALFPRGLGYKKESHRSIGLSGIIHREQSSHPSIFHRGPKDAGIVRHLMI